MSNVFSGKGGKVTIENDDCIIVLENIEQFDVIAEEDINMMMADSSFAGPSSISIPICVGRTVSLHTKGDINGLTVTQKEDEEGKKCKEKVTRQIRFRKN